MESTSSSKYETIIRKIVRDEIARWFQSDYNIDLEDKIRTTVEMMEEEKHITNQLEKGTDEQRFAHVLVADTINSRVISLKTFYNCSLTRVSLPAIIYRNGKQNLIRSISVPENPQNFINLGFRGYEEFFSYPVEVRNYFCSVGMDRFNQVFGEHWEKLPDKDLEDKLEALQGFLGEIVKKIRDPAFIVPH